MARETIFVFLPDEPVPEWVPVDAERIGDGIYRIMDCRSRDDSVEFAKGSVVRCRRQVLSGDFGQSGECLVAYESAN